MPDSRYDQKRSALFTPGPCEVDETVPGTFLRKKGLASPVGTSLAGLAETEE